jgi:hypothetical protein
MLEKLMTKESWLMTGRSAVLDAPLSRKQKLGYYMLTIVIPWAWAKLDQFVHSQQGSSSSVSVGLLSIVHFN